MTNWRDVWEGDSETNLAARRVAPKGISLRRALWAAPVALAVAVGLFAGYGVGALQIKVFQGNVDQAIAEYEHRLVEVEAELEQTRKSYAQDTARLNDQVGQLKAAVAASEKEAAQVRTSLIAALQAIDKEVARLVLQAGSEPSDELLRLRSTVQAYMGRIERPSSPVKKSQ